jgi:hypothetical protein
LWGQGVFTVQVGSSGAPVSLVDHTDTWRFHKGTNAPAPGWQTNADSTLDSTWGSGPGGFGYADNIPELASVQTPLADMQNRYTTFYLRRSFDITNAIDPAQPLQLMMDWDDGWMASSLTRGSLRRALPEPSRQLAPRQPALMNRLWATTCRSP